VDLDGAPILEDATAMELDSLDSTVPSPSAKWTSLLVLMEDSATHRMEDAIAQELDIKEKSVRMTSTNATRVHLLVPHPVSTFQEDSLVHHVLKEQLELRTLSTTLLEYSSLEDAFLQHQTCLHLNRSLKI